MQTSRFGRKLKLPATIAIKHQVKQLMFEDAVKTAEAEARAEAIRTQLRRRNTTGLRRRVAQVAGARLGRLKG